MSATAVKCAFCNRPAVRWHAPAPINGKTFAGIPLCDSKCNTIPKRKRP